MDVNSIVAASEKTYKKKIVWGGVQERSGDRISTGWFPLDLATGGGVPVGFVSIMYGQESSLKTTLALRTIAAAQRQFPDKKAVFIDVESHLDKGWAGQLGVDTDNLVYVLPDNAEQVVDLAAKFVLEADDLSILVIDSLAALVTDYELGQDAEKVIVGKTGMIINKLYRKLGNALAQRRQQGIYPTIICINQVRANIGAMFGPTETMTGGRSFKYASGMTIRLYGKDVMDNDVSKVLPSYKNISATIEKWKQPILQKNVKFDVALRPIEKLNIVAGESDDWTPTLYYLKYLQLLGGGSGAWELLHPTTGEVITYKTQDAIKTDVLSNHNLALSLQQQIIEKLKLEGT